MVKSLIPKTLLVMFYAGVTLMPFSCGQPDSYEIKISGPVTIGGEWIEIHSERPLKAEKTYQYIVLDLEPPFKDDLYEEGKGPNTGQGILMPDGEIINPEIEVVDQNGNTFKLVWAGAIGIKPKYCLPYPNELPRDRVYTAVRIRSPRPIKCSAIYWFCDSSKDWP